MKLRCSDYIILVLLSLTGQAQAQKWFTLDVAREVGLEPCESCSLGRGEPIKVSEGQITPVTMFYFDTIASYAQGRIVDIATGNPIGGATIQVQYSCWDDCDQKTAATNDAGFFRLGWVGCHGPKGGRANYPLLIQAAGYQKVATDSAKFGGGAYLHIELAALPRRR